MRFSNNLREDFYILSQFAAALTEAHSCAIFLPSELLGTTSVGAKNFITLKHSDKTITDKTKTIEQYSSIDLVAAHSPAKIVRDCRIQVGHGLLGWVAEQGRPIHLTPLEVGSSALAIYVDQEPVKSLIAVPILLELPKVAPHSATLPHSAALTAISRGPFGVLMCDSLSAAGFSNTRIKNLEQIASIIQRLLAWVGRAATNAHVETSWEVFKQKTAELGDAIGHASIEILRIRLESLAILESLGGISLAVQLSEQFVRLAQQALPPHFPCTRLPDGDVVLALDDMMSGFFQQKLQTLAQHLHTEEKPLRINIETYRAKLAQGGQCSVDATLQQQPLSIKTSANIGSIRA